MTTSDDAKYTRPNVLRFSRLFDLHDQALRQDAPAVDKPEVSLPASEAQKFLDRACASLTKRPRR
ncbi:MAG: hypothetical protein QNJ09_03640 [Paracoccaceae bacterium]|nr:hypothetical protein [Paracoccaceae bacterium]